MRYLIIVLSLLLTGCAINNQPCEKGAEATVEVGSWLIIKTCKEE